MNIYEKLLEIQKSVDHFVKDMTVGEGRQAHKAVASEQVLEMIRPLLNDLKLLCIPSINAGRVQSDKTASGTTRYFTELDMTMTWLDVESGETHACPWYGQGTDLAGEKGVGKANTYAEKYFFMKFFHVPTSKDDPDNDNRTKGGELKVQGTQSAKELSIMYRKAIPQMMNELYGGDAEKIKTAYVAITKNESSGYAGVDNIEAVKDKPLAIVYAKTKQAYTKRMGKEFILKIEEEENND